MRSAPSMSLGTTAAGVERNGRRFGRFHSVYTIKLSLRAVFRTFGKDIPVGITSSDPFPMLNHNGSPSGDKYKTWVVLASQNLYFKALATHSRFVEMCAELLR